MWHVAQHEGFHQFAWSRFAEDLPVWVNEGMAEFFGESVIVGDTLRRIGKLDLPDLEIVEALEEWRYRSKISMAAKGGEGAATAVGLHPYDRPNFVFPLADCHITAFRLMGRNVEAASKACSRYSMRSMPVITVEVGRFSA